MPLLKSVWNRLLSKLAIKVMFNINHIEIASNMFKIYHKKISEIEQVIYVFDALESFIK